MGLPCRVRLTIARRQIRFASLEVILFSDYFTYAAGMDQQTARTVSSRAQVSAQHYFVAGFEDRFDEDLCTGVVDSYYLFFYYFGFFYYLYE